MWLWGDGCLRYMVGKVSWMDSYGDGNGNLMMQV